jgi:hypothetical protein
MNSNVLTVCLTVPWEADIGGDGGVSISNADSVSAVYPILPNGSFAAACSKNGNHDLVRWSASRVDQFAASHFLMLDDLGTKMPLERLAALLGKPHAGRLLAGIIPSDNLPVGAAHPQRECGLTVGCKSPKYLLFYGNRSSYGRYQPTHSGTEKLQARASQ